MDDQEGAQDAAAVEGHLPSIAGHEDPQSTSLEPEESDEPPHKKARLGSPQPTGALDTSTAGASSSATSTTDPRFSCAWDSDLTDLEDEDESEGELVDVEPEERGAQVDNVAEEELEEGEVPDEEELEAARARALAKRRQNALRMGRRRAALTKKKVQVETSQAQQTDGTVIPQVSAGDYYGRMRVRLTRLALHRATKLTPNDLPHSTKGYIGAAKDAPPVQAFEPGTARSSWPDLDELLPSSDPRYIQLRDARDANYGYGTADDM